MTINEFKIDLKNNIKHSKSVAFRFEREGRHHHYRDCIFAYYDGKFIFKRFCYGEAAGIVFSVNIENILNDGTIIYKEPLPLGVKKEDIPHRITKIINTSSIELDNNSTYLWNVLGKLNSDNDFGYSRLKFLITRWFI